MVDGEGTAGHSHETRHPEIWPRSTVACNGCRARKQKCGGERPTCVRCRTLNQDCEWPKQQKRGPAKGYTEALEARLLETENILLGCLSTISDDNLHAVLSQSFQLALERQTSLGMGLPKSSTVQRKAVIDYWGRFPLTSPAGVSHWYHDRAESGDAIRASSQMWPEDVSQSGETATRIKVREEPTPRNGEPFDMDVDELEPPQNYHTASKIRNDPHGSEVYKEQYDQYKGTQTTADQPSWHDDPPLGPVSGTPQSRSSIINNTVDCGLGLSAEFQETFLW